LPGEERDTAKDQDWLVEPLLDWFGRSNRPLPWRQSYDPYHVWISEIMLQQTQMERGVAYFLRWIDRFADVRAVAEAAEQEILKYWEGLGYYARARNLHRAAKEIVRRFAGVVPGDYPSLRSLPGIGPYTAAAIASVAGNQDIPVVDANVLRVYSRIFDIAQPIEQRATREQIETLAWRFLPAGRARVFNQALMDLGGLVCTPRRPRCDECPLTGRCLARQAGTVASRPVRRPPRQPVLIEKVAGVIVDSGRIYLQQRSADALWGGLWEFPGGELTGEESPVAALQQKVFADCGLLVRVRQPLPPIRHGYTHHRVTLHGFFCELSGGGRQPHLSTACAFHWVTPADLHRYAFPAGPRKLLAAIGNYLAL